MKKVFLRAGLICWLCIGLLVPAMAGSFQVIISGDTNDESIGESVGKDMTNVKAFVKKVSDMTGMPLKMVVLTGNDFTTNKLTQAVEKMSVGPDDTVLFYNSSHGFRTQNKTTIWPYIHISDGDGLDEYWVYQKLAAKKPRLLLVLADVCNVLMDAPDSRRGLSPRPSNSPEVENMKLLFTKASGAIIASSSKPGEYSLAYAAGGAFTLAWMKALKDAIAANAPPKWDSIFKLAVKPLNKGTDSEQNPQYKTYSLKEGTATGDSGNVAQATATPTPRPATPSPTARVTPKPTPVKTEEPAEQDVLNFVFKGGSLTELGSGKWNLTRSKKVLALVEYERSDGYIYLEDAKTKKDFFCLDPDEPGLYHFDADEDDWVLFAKLMGVE